MEVALEVIVEDKEEHWEGEQEGCSSIDLNKPIERHECGQISLVFFNWSCKGIVL